MLIAGVILGFSDSIVDYFSVVSYAGMHDGRNMYFRNATRINS